MFSCKASNFSVSGFCFILILLHVSALPWSATADLVARSGGVLRVLVPVKSDFKELVDCTDSSNVEGFSIDVFRNALSILIPKPSWTDVEYQCYPIGDDSYDSMIDHLADSKDIDAVIGDVTISAARLLNASFTQTFLDAGIVIVAPDEAISQSFPGVLFAPFTKGTWAILFGSILLTGLSLLLLEYNDNPFLQEAAPSRLQKLNIILWFVMSILMFFKKDLIRNRVAKFIMIGWILFILFLGSSYTASLSSILTVSELSQKSLTMDDLVNKNMTVGYQVGSNVKDYLERRHNITKLKELYNTAQYADALLSKEVGAVVDEIPYISLFLSAQSASNCTFSVSKKLTIEGLGFAFHDRNLSAAFSVAILNLSESGKMQTIQDGWKLSNFQCPSRIQSTRVGLPSLKMFFILLGGAILICIVYCMLKHTIVPCSIQTYERFRVNRRTHGIGAFQDGPCRGGSQLALSSHLNNFLRCRYRRS